MEKHLLICIDGVDGTGKSTLAKALSQRYNIPVYSPTFPTKDGERAPREFKRWSDIVVSDMYAKFGFSLIMDRSFMSACVYEPDLPYKDALIKKWAENVLTYGSALHIVLFGSEFSLDVFQKRKTDFVIPIQTLKEQQRSFLDYAKKFESEFKIPVARIRSLHSEEEVLRSAIDVIQKSISL